MLNIARRLQTVQYCYNKATNKLREPLTWKASIKNKIAFNKSNIILLNQKALGEKHLDAEII